MESSIQSILGSSLKNNNHGKLEVKRFTRTVLRLSIMPDYIFIKLSYSSFRGYSNILE